jgi:phosphohistidine swiveling domain-containing protein
VEGLPYVEGFDVARPDPARQGGKGASLSRLTARGYRIPRGFVVTVDAFRATIDSLGLDGALAEVSDGLSRSEDVADPGMALVRGLLVGRIPDDVLAEVLHAARDVDLFPSGARSAIVRSSATIEDSASHSFAGIFESIPAAGLDELEPAIRTVWASAFSPRALAYAAQPGLHRAADMAVVVQRFVDAWRSGVMFTRFGGSDGAEHILIEHVEGGCEKLVRGEVIPERLWLPATDGELERGPNGGSGSSPTEAAGATAGGLLPERHVQELVRLAGDLEQLFGGPQDVEWVIESDVVHVVQSRPITVGAARSKEAGPPSAGERNATGREDLVPVLSGLGASPGRGSGPVRLVFNIEQALGLRTGQVLVTPMTNPDMVVAMRNASAIVTDVGGMICHAAIVSRELGLPCVVGTETATATLVDEALVTVDGNVGHVYDGVVQSGQAPAGRPIDWADVWALWDEALVGADRTDVVPLVSTVGALEAAPQGLREVVLVPDIDLRCDPNGLWQDLDGLPDREAFGVVRAYVRRVFRAAEDRAVGMVQLAPDDDRLVAGLAEAVRIDAAGRLELGPLESRPAREVQPLGRVAALGVPESGGAPPLATPGDGFGIDGPLATALDTLSFFGHRPGVHTSAMPDPSVRAGWWAALPEYGRFHAEHGTAGQNGEFEWLEVRPELVISALLKSLVQPGFEMVPRVMGFPDLPPMHVTWIRCRYHFRADVFARVWEAIVRATYDEAYMVDLMRRVRASYRSLAEVLVLFPRTEEELRALDGDRMVALITSWWPRWVEFFALCWFIQAQGDDVAYPFMDVTVRRNLDRLGPPPAGLAWPGPADFVAPTTPVMSGEYMADVGALREDLFAAGLTDLDAALSALDRGEHPAIAARLGRHLERWGWMRDRDLLFEPWDTPRRVIETALATEPHAVVPYAENLRRQLLALGFHADLSRETGRAHALNHHTRFLHDLNVERENHHVLWLKDSYPLRRVVLEIQRRLVEVGSLRPGDIFFLQAPELLEAAARLPEPLPEEVEVRVGNRRAGFEREARLSGPDGPEPEREGDYY